MLFASLLPGLRDLRAPLSAGFIWLVAGWLYFAPHVPTSITDVEEVLQDIDRVIEVSSPLMVGAGLSFAAYLVGILSTGLLMRPVREILLIPMAFLLWMVTLFLYLLLRAQSKRLPPTGGAVRALFDWTSESPGRLLHPAFVRARILAVRRIGEKILADPEYRDAFIQRFNNESLDYYLFRMREAPFLTSTILNIDESREKVKRLVKAREILCSHLELEDRAAVEILVRSVVDVEHHAHDIVDELELVPERIVEDKPATYERWDRLNAEGEFRQAVVPPLLAIIVALVSRGVLGWPLGLLCLLPVLIILFQGIGKEYAAQSQLIQLLDATVIRSASIERLTTTDLHWRRAT